MQPLRSYLSSSTIHVKSQSKEPAFIIPSVYTQKHACQAFIKLNSVWDGGITGVNFIWDESSRQGEAYYNPPYGTE